MSRSAATPTADVLVQVRGLRTVLGRKTIFDGVDLDIPRGKVTAVMGPSGCGKTTLLRHLTGQCMPDAGAVRIDGADVPTLSRQRLFDLRERIGYLFQNSALLTDYDVFENVAFPLRQHLKLPEEIVRNIVLTKLEAVGLRGAASLMPAELSGGMKQRVALARALVGRPKALLADEPTGNLDFKTGEMIMDLLDELHRSHQLTSIYVTHNQKFAARCDRVLKLDKGELFSLDSSSQGLRE